MVSREQRGAIWGGLVGAMAMTGVRRVTTGLGLVQETPPEALVRRGGLFERVPPQHRAVAVELLHWGVGMALGAAYAALPRAVRRSRLAGPLYGAATLAGFEAGVAPALGMARARERRAVERIAIAADHVLYGLVVGRSQRSGERRAG